jgi:hypothetical protein
MQPATGAAAPAAPAAPAPPSPYAPPASPYAPPPYATPAPTAYVAGQPAYAPYASQPMWPADTAPPGVDVDFRRDAIRTTSRATVAFRLLLAIPHLIAFWAVGIAAYVVLIVAWFAALFTARVPEGIYGFVGWVIRYGTRVSSYLLLLTDRWPTFNETPDDPVQVRLPGPQRLNRAAVFFRLILMIPGYIVVAVVIDGLIVAEFFIWLIVLFRGRVPQPAFDATASAVRYQTRFYAFAAMLTARQPDGLYGDTSESADADARDEGGVAAPPKVNRPARRLLTVLVVLGVLAVIGNIAATIAFGGDTAKRQRADNHLAHAYRSMHLTNAQTCVGTADPLTCVRESAGRNASKLRTFEDDVAAIEFPSDTVGAVAELRQATDRFISDMAALSQATSLRDYDGIARSRDLSGDGRAVDDAVQQLSTELARADGI